MNAQDVELMEWCQGLGQMETTPDPNTREDISEFHAGDEALMCLKGVDEMLRRDNSELQPMHLRLGSWHTVRTHLLPLLVACCKKAPIVYQCIKVLVRMTMPIAAIVENKITRLSHLQLTKAWCLEGDYLTTIMWIMSRALEKHPDERSDEDRNFLDLILTLIKNLLCVPDPETGDEFQKKLHDRCIVKMHEALVFETLSVLATTIDSSTDTSTKYLLQDCFVQIFRQEKHAEDLFIDEASEAADAKAAEAAAVAEAGGKSKSKSKETSSAAPAKLNPTSAFVSSEAARLSANLSASLTSARMTDRAMTKSAMARHARFGSKYSITVKPSLTTANGTPKVLHNTIAGPDGENVHCAVPPVSGPPSSGDAIFAARLVRNPFGVANQSRMVTDSLASHRGFKRKLDSSRRVFLNPSVKLALYESACQILDVGAWNALAKQMLRELETSATKDIIASDDARAYMQISAFFMNFQRVRSKRLVRAGEKAQKAREKVRDAAELKAWKEEQELQERETAQLMADRARMAAIEGVATGANSSGVGESGGSAAPLFPNVINSAGEMSHAETQVEGVPNAAPAAAGADASAVAPAVTSAILFEADADLDESFLPAPAAAAAAAAPVAPAKPTGPPKRPFVREVVYDVAPISASVSFDAWKYLNKRVALYTEDRPLPWSHLAAAINMYKELLRNLYEMHALGNVTLRLKADSMRRALFYDRETIELFGGLVQTYNAARVESAYLADLVTAIHYQCKILEDLAKPGAGHTILEKRRRVVRRKKEKKIDIRNPEDVAAIRTDGAAAAKEEKKQGESEESALVAALHAELVASEEKEPGAASPVKKRKTIFEHDDEEEGINVDAEGEEPKPEASQPEFEADPGQVKSGSAEGAAGAGADDDDEYEDVEIEEDGPPVVSRRESEFDFHKFFARFAHPQVVSAYLDLLAQYRRNHTETNHMILVFFQRLSRIHLNGFFFQLRAFVLFEQILTDEWIKTRPVYDDLRVWIKGVTREFLQIATKRPTEEQMVQDPQTDAFPGRHLWLEALFWKNMLTADRLLNENGWFDRTKDRARSARDAQALPDDNDDWVDIDEDEEAQKAAERSAEQAREAEAEAEAGTSTWVNSDVTLRAKAWKPQEDQLLREQYPLYKDNEACMDILQSMLPSRTALSLRERLKKLGVFEKRVRGERTAASSSKSRSSAASSKKKKVDTLADMLDRHDSYTKVAPLDDIMDRLRELVVELVQKDCRTTVHLMIDQLKACRDARARVDDDTDLTESFAFESQESEGWDHDANDQLNTMFKLIGMPDREDKEAAWTVPKHFTSANLTALIDLLSSTLDNPSSADPRDEDVENDAAISRLLASSQKQTGGGDEEEDADDTSAEQARLEKAARRARRAERERAEAAELAASSQVESRPRRRRAEEIQAERIRVNREATERRRREQEALDEEAEQSYEGSSLTAVGAIAVAQAKVAESTPAANFSKADLNDFMALKRQRGLEAMLERERKLAEATAQMPSRKRHSAAPEAAATVSPPKRAKRDGKKRLRRAADSDEDDAGDETIPPAPMRLSDETVSPTEDEPMSLLDDAADMEDVVQPEETNDAPDAAEDEPTPSAARNAAHKKKRARRIADSDEDEEEAEAAVAEEPEAAEHANFVDAAAATPSANTTIDTQAPTQRADLDLDAAPSFESGTVPPTESQEDAHMS